MKDQLVRALQRYPVFTVKDIANVLQQSRSYAYLVAYRLKKNGAIREIEKGKYTLETDPFLIASWVVWPSYISGWAALHYYHLTEQLPFTIQVITTRKRNKKSLVFLGTTIEFTTIRQAAFCGFQKEPYQGREIFLARGEKALIDGLLTRKISLVEALEIIRRHRRNISRRKLLAFARSDPELAARLRRGLA